MAESGLSDDHPAGTKWHQTLPPDQLPPSCLQVGFVRVVIPPVQVAIGLAAQSWNQIRGCRRQEVRIPNGLRNHAEPTGAYAQNLAVVIREIQCNGPQSLDAHHFHYFSGSILAFVLRQLPASA